MAHANEAVGPLRGNSLASKALDLFVIAHVLCAGSSTSTRQHLMPCAAHLTGVPH